MVKVQQITFPTEALVLAVEAIECSNPGGKNAFTIVTSRLAIGLSIYSYSEKRLQNIFNLPFAHGFVSDPYLRFSRLNPDDSTVDVDDFDKDGGSDDGKDIQQKLIILCTDRLLQFFYEIELVYSDLIPRDSEMKLSSKDIMKNMLTRKYDLAEEFLISLKKVVNVVNYNKHWEGDKHTAGILFNWISTSGTLQVDESLNVDLS